jgi:anti-anti-sigma factor
MERPYRHIEVECVGDVHCVRLKQLTLDENALYEMADELHHLGAQDDCRKLVLSLGPEEPRFLYSVFLAKLVTLQRRLQAHGGKLKIADASVDTRSVFDACGLTPLFDFAPDRATALAAFAEGTR